MRLFYRKLYDIVLRSIIFKAKELVEQLSRRQPQVVHLHQPRLLLVAVNSRQVIVFLKSDQDKN